MSKKKRIVKKILNALREPAPMNYNRGPIIREFTRTHSKKDRKRKGHAEARYVNPKMKYKDAHAQAIDPLKFWDDWQDRRDGMRHNTNPDQLYHEWRGCCNNKEYVYDQNHKIIKQIRIRKARIKRWTRQLT